MIRVLVVSENEVLLRNLREYFSDRVNSGDLILDHAKTRDDSIAYLEKHSYEKIFHNGVFIFDIIERTQFGSEVYNYGKINNQYKISEINPTDIKSFSGILYKKWFHLGVNIGGYVTKAVAVIALIGAASFAYSTRSDIDTNIGSINTLEGHVLKIDKSVEGLGNGQKKIESEVKSLITIMKVVYGDKAENVLNGNEN
jgi:hypothetical protein